MTSKIDINLNCMPRPIYLILLFFTFFLFFIGMKNYNTWDTIFSLLKKNITMNFHKYMKKHV